MTGDVGSGGAHRQTAWVKRRKMILGQCGEHGSVLHIGTQFGAGFRRAAVLRVTGPLGVGTRKINGCHNGIGRTGCAEQHGVFAQCAAVHACRGEQNGALSHARQRFVHGEHGHIRTFRDRRRQADGREVCTVCTVYEQQLAVRAAQIGKLGNRPPDAVIGRRGQKDRLDLRMRDQLCFRILDRKRTGNREWLDQRCRKEIRRNAEQRAAVADGLVYLAVEQDSAAASDRCAEHGENALCRAAGQKKAVLRAEIPRGGNLRIADRTFTGVQVAGAVGFGKVDGKNIRVCVENRLTFVPGHVKPRGVAGLEQLQSMEQRRRCERHQAVDLSVIGTVAVRRSRSAVVHNTVGSLLL